MNPQRTAVLSILLISLSIGSGCALFDPHIRLKDNDVADVDYSAFSGNLPQAIERAGKLRGKYLKAVSDHSLLRSVAGLSMIPLSASALYLGFASSANAELASGLGLGAAGIYGASNYLHSSPRQLVYINGAAALTCAVKATRPVLVKSDDYSKLENGLTAISTGVNRVNSAIVAVNAAIKNQSHPTSLSRTATLQVTQAKALLVQAQDVRARGTAYKRNIDTAGLSLNSAVDAIQAEVSRQVLKTEPDLASVMTIAGSLGQWAGTFGSVPAIVPQTSSAGGTAQASGKSVGAQSESETPDDTELRNGINKLAEATSETVEATSSVADIVNAIGDADQQLAGLDQCEVGAADTGFSISPDVASQTLNAGSSTMFIITDDTGIPQSVRLLGPADKKATLSTEVLGGGLVATVTATSDAPSSLYQLHVSDSTGKNKRTISIQVQPKADGGTDREEKKLGTNTSVTEKKWQEFLKDGEKSFIGISIENAKDVQRSLNKALRLNLKVDGKFGSETRAAIFAYQKRHQAEGGMGLADKPDSALSELFEQAKNKLISENPPDE